MSTQKEKKTPLQPVPDTDRKAALAAATAARKTRSDIVARVSAGELSPSRVIELAAEDKAISRLRPERLARAIPGVGPARAADFISRACIASTKRLGGLGKNQKAILGEALDAAWNKAFE